MKFLFVLLFTSFVSGRIIERTSQIKCQEYNDEIKKNNICLESQKYPFLAGVGFENKNITNGIRWACTGVLVSDQYILTPAICVTFPGQSEKKYVLLGSTNLFTSPEILQVSEIITYPEYVYNLSQPINDKNIALLKLEKPVEFSASIQPACLFSGEYQQKYNVAGYLINAEHEDDVDGAIVNDQSKLEEDENCGKKYKEHYNKDINFEKYLCTVDGPKACGYKLSAGSPLLLQNGTSECLQHVVGLTDIGPLTCSDFPVLNLKISAIVDWIESIVW